MTIWLSLWYNCIAKANQLPHRLHGEKGFHMAHYDYYTAVTNDVIDDIRESIAGGYLNTREYADRDDLREKLYDDLWTADNVTGNGSGSYTFNSARAAEYVTDNTDLLREALHEFGYYREDLIDLIDKFLDGEWEYFDVTIRCYVLGSAIEDALDALEETGEIKYGDEEVA